MPELSSPPLQNGLPPVVDNATRILILGSFPGQVSLASSQYYAHPRNQFWRLLSAILNDDLASLPYASRLQKLLATNIGLWDVIATCSRQGSLDSAIRQAQANQFEQLRHLCPHLRRVCFNGKTSGKFAPAFEEAGYQTLVLPSSSPANMQLTFDEKLAQWRRIID